MISAIEASDIIYLSRMVQPCNNVLQLIQTCMYRDPVCAAPVSGLGKHNKRGLSLPSCSDPLAMMDAAVEAARPEDAADNDASVGASNCVPVRNLRGYKAGDGR